jgi:hypothetical protein
MSEGKKSPPEKIDNSIVQGAGLSGFQEGVNDFFNKLTLSDAMFLTPSEWLDGFKLHIVQCAKEVATMQNRSRLDWLLKVEHSLTNLIRKKE